MKNQLCLFLILVTLLSIFANANTADIANAADKKKEYLKFVQQEEVDMQYHSWYGMNINAYSNDAPSEAACVPIYNTERNGTRRNKYDIEGFKLETDIHFILQAYQQINIEIKILDNDTGDGKSTNLSDTNTVETCQTIGSSYRFWTYKHYRIQCNTRKFKKNYVVAVCSWNKNFYIWQQRHLITASGFVNKNDVKK
jgi:hypothetical protein